MKPVLRILILLILVGGGGAATWYWKFRPPEPPSELLTLYGNVDVRQVELAINGSELMGRVLVEEGDLIEPGQLLAELEQERFELAVQRAEAQIQTQQQVVARLEAGTRAEEIREAEAELAAAQAALVDAKSTYKRILDLFNKEADTQQNVDDALSKQNVAAANVRFAEAKLDLAKAGPRKEDIAQAKAVLQRMKVELKQARHDLEDTKLLAPSRAVVQERILEVGEMVSPQKPVFTVALLDPIWVRTYVSEPDLGRIHEGMQASIETDSFPGKKYPGWIGFISPTAEFTPKPVETTELRTKLVYQVRVFVKNPNFELRLGMPATVHIALDQSSKETSQTKDVNDSQPEEAGDDQKANGEAEQQ